MVALLAGSAGRLNCGAAGWERVERLNDGAAGWERAKRLDDGGRYCWW